jgi:formylglycine-generating enzyme required for sulfatase activity
MDMAGNVAEWVYDGYQEKENFYEVSPDSNPKRSPNGWSVIRGGAWGTSDFYARSAARYHELSVQDGHWIGFRCVRDP